MYSFCLNTGSKGCIWLIIEYSNCKMWLSFALYVKYSENILSSLSVVWAESRTQIICLQLKYSKKWYECTQDILSDAHPSSLELGCLGFYSRLYSTDWIWCGYLDGWMAGQWHVDNKTTAYCRSNFLYIFWSQIWSWSTTKGTWFLQTEV